MVIMPTTAIDGLIKLGRLKQDGYKSFGTVRLVAIAKKGAVRPDISTPDAFKDALLKASSVVYSTPTATLAALIWRSWSAACKFPMRSRRR